MQLALFAGLITALVAAPLVAAVAIDLRRPQWRDPIVLSSQLVLLGALAFASFSFLRHFGTSSESATQWIPLTGLVILASALALWWTGRGVLLSVVSWLTSAGCVFSFFSWVGWTGMGWVLLLLAASVLSAVLGRHGRARSGTTWISGVRSEARRS